MFYLNTIEQVFLFVEQLYQLEVCLVYLIVVATMLFDKLGTDSLVKLNVELNIFIQNLDDIEELTTKIDTIKNDVNDKDEFLITFGPRAIW